MHFWRAFCLGVNSAETPSGSPEVHWKFTANFTLILQKSTQTSFCRNFAVTYVKGNQHSPAPPWISREGPVLSVGRGLVRSGQLRPDIGPPWRPTFIRGAALLANHARGLLPFQFAVCSPFLLDMSSSSCPNFPKIYTWRGLNLATLARN